MALHIDNMARVAMGSGANGESAICRDHTSIGVSHGMCRLALQRLIGHRDSGVLVGDGRMTDSHVESDQEIFADSSRVIRQRSLWIC